MGHNYINEEIYMYRNLFSPIRINTLEIKNRIAYRYFNYFQERANGGVGLLTVGPVGVDFIGSGAIALSLANDDAIGDFQKLTGIIKDGGARAWIQLFHAGAYSHPMFVEGQQPIRIRCLLRASSPLHLQRSIRGIPRQHHVK
jgi:2,4-dienoyl-CoA reductase (NADPH2)